MEARREVRLELYKMCMFAAFQTLDNTTNQNNLEI